jgi:hypothetical protein
MYFAYIYLATKSSVMIGQVRYDVRVSPSMKHMKGKGGKKARGTRASGGSVPRRGIIDKAKNKKEEKRKEGGGCIICIVTNHAPNIIRYYQI